MPGVHLNDANLDILGVHRFNNTKGHWESRKQTPLCDTQITVIIYYRQIFA